MKSIKILLLPIFSVLFIACEEEENLNDAQEEVNTSVKQALSLDATADYVLYDLDNDEVVSAGEDWDIGFLGTTTVINGGTVVNEDPGTDRLGNANPSEPARESDAAIYFVSEIFSEFEGVNTSLFLQDSAENFALLSGSDNGWYNYTGDPNHLILPIPGRTLIVKTSEGNYVKIEMISYYENGVTPDDYTEANSRFITFNYAFVE